MTFATVHLPPTEREVLCHLADHGRQPVLDASSFWDGPRRRAAGRLLGRGLLERRRYANGGAHELTDAGSREAASLLA